MAMSDRRVTLCSNACYYMTINILDSDWTKHYFTLHFKCDDHRSKVYARLTLLLNTVACTQK